MKTAIVIILFLALNIGLCALLLPFANLMAVGITLAIPYVFWRLVRG
jgi:hypothetical protein